MTNSLPIHPEMSCSGDMAQLRAELEEGSKDLQKLKDKIALRRSEQDSLLRDIETRQNKAKWIR